MHVFTLDRHLLPYPTAAEPFVAGLMLHAAWGGADCSKPVKRPCAHALGGLRHTPPEPFTHIGPDKLDLNLSKPNFHMGR
jgi:hypothetical protein